MLLMSRGGQPLPSSGWCGHGVSPSGLGASYHRTRDLETSHDPLDVPRRSGDRVPGRAPTFGSSLSSVYQASSPAPSWKVLVGPSLPIVAMRTMASAHFSTGCRAPMKGVRSVAVKPGSTALNLISDNALAY